MQHRHTCEKSRHQAPGSSRRSKQAGFTLIELLVVCAILAVVIAAIGACLAGGVRVWDTARRFHVGESEAILAMEHMSRDLGGTFVCPEITFHAERQEISFPGIVPGGDNKEGSLGTITYTFKQGQGTLTRESAVYPDGRVRSEVLLSNAQDLQCKAEPPQGVYGLANTGLPARVEIEIVILEYDQIMKLSRTVSMPAGGR